MKIDYDKLNEKAIERKEALTALELVLAEAAQNFGIAVVLCEYLRHVKVAFDAIDAEALSLLPPDLISELRLVDDVANNPLIRDACRVADVLEAIANIVGAQP